ncbi:MAG: hypothetical protein JW795_11460 [Chitinivibrionales bacterium]|nr:hypothetical protein [Chitinivibrionales bacterium]
MAKLLGIDPDPSNGGIDKGVTYIVFAGEAGNLKKYDDHARAVAIGDTMAQALVAQTGIIKSAPHSKAFQASVYRIHPPFVSITSEGPHTVQLVTCRGQTVFTQCGTGPQTYDLSRRHTASALYILKVTAASAGAIYTENCIW